MSAAGLPVDSRRLWSLWEMLEKHAFLFVVAISALSETKWIIVATVRGNADSEQARAQIHAAGKHGLSHFRKACEASEMFDVTPEIDRLAQSFDMLLAEREYSLETVSQAIKYLISRIQDELNSEFFFHLRAPDASRYSEEFPFGVKVTQKFNKATEDIAESSKCLALQRSTSCVFHLMRALELAVQAFGKKLKVKTDVRTETRHQIMLHVNKAIMSLPSKTSRQKAKKSAYASAAGFLDTARLASRNEVMHPKQTYTMQEALALFDATKAFMMRLADLI